MLSSLLVDEDEGLGSQFHHGEVSGERWGQLP